MAFTSALLLFFLFFIFALPIRTKISHPSAQFAILLLVSVAGADL